MEISILGLKGQLKKIKDNIYTINFGKCGGFNNLVLVIERRQGFVVVACPNKINEYYVGRWTIDVNIDKQIRRLAHRLKIHMIDDYSLATCSSPNTRDIINKIKNIILLIATKNGLCNLIKEANKNVANKVI